MTYNIDEACQQELASELQKIYTHVIFEDVENSSEFVNSIVKSVDTANKAKVNLDNNVAYRLDISHLLASEFLRNISPIMDEFVDKISIANNFLQNTGDIVALTVPYFLLKMNIGNEEISFIINLCIILVKIILNNISNYKEQKDTQLQKDKLLKMGQDSLSYVKKSNGISSELDNYQDLLETIISSL